MSWIRAGRGVIASFAGSWRFEEIGASETRVTFEYHLRARPGLLTPLVGWVFGRDTRRRLAALKSAVESGRVS